MWLARRARARGNWRAVAAHCQKVLRSEPRLSAVWVELGRSQQIQADYAGAEASYRQALAIDSRRADVHLRLGHVLKLQHRFSEAAESYFSAVRLNLRSPARGELASLRYCPAEIDAARKTGALPPSALLTRLDTAGRAWAAGDLRKLAAELAEILQAEPDWSEVWIYSAYAQSRQSDFAAAEASLRRALALDPAAAATQLLLGQALKAQRRLVDASASFFRAVQLDPNSPARDELGTLGYSRPALDAALRSGRLAEMPLEHLEAADRARTDGDWPTVVAHLSKAVAANPNWPTAWVYLGHAQKLQGDSVSAEVSYRRALANDPNLAETQLQLGRVLEAQGRFDEAAESLLNTVRLAPKTPEGLSARGELIRFGYRNGAIDAALANGSLSWPPAGRPVTPAEARPILSLVGAHLPPVREAGQALPTVLRQPIHLPDREISLLVDVQMVGSRGVPAVQPSILTEAGEIAVETVPNSYGDNVLTFRARPGSECDAEFIIRADLPSDALIRRVEIGLADHSKIWPLPYRGVGPIELPTDQIRNLIIGSTGVCNASCPHCPTNKLVPSAQAAGEMPLEVFHRLVDQIVDNRMFISGFISLGLFGDGLLDRHVVERARSLRTAFPHVSLHVNTNAAAYNRQRHAALGSIIDTMAVHIETLDEEKYARLMEPLRLKNVLPRIHQIIEDMAPVVSIASPMHRENVDELEVIKTYFRDRGVSNTIFTRMSNRCSRDEMFQELAPGAISGTCPEDIIFDLIIDWDGTVLLCCNDFLRKEPIGNIAHTPLADILRGAKRQRAFDALRTGKWQELETCRTCKWGCGYSVAAA